MSITGKAINLPKTLPSKGSDRLIEQLPTYRVFSMTNERRTREECAEKASSDSMETMGKWEDEVYYVEIRDGHFERRTRKVWVRI